ncbi:MAG: cation diffusion facilitator family transporter [Candidatus Kapabacteria bacterium]|jgi:cation diffusion facilitator family transporter|nr:cation diffusion facilitator family transporter [Candidatus Kapabacteria bacterium]
MIKTKEHIAVKAAYFSIFGNLALAILKGITGYFGNSFALIADAIESTGDVVSSTLVLAGLKYSSMPPDKNHPYGHGKAEPLVTFIVVGFLVAAAAIIGYQSIVNIQTPHELPEPYTLYILGAIILTKEIFYRIVLSRSKQTNSTSLKADAWHHRSDAITSLAAFIGISLALILGKGYENADDWAALTASFVILYNSFLIFRPALGEVMDEHLYDSLIEEIRKAALTVDGVLGTEKCLVRKAGMNYLVDLHIEVDSKESVKAGHSIAHRLKLSLMKEFPDIANVLIHVEPYESEMDE